MPLKLFYCPKCKESFELLLNREKFDATEITSCTKCATPSPYTISAPAKRAPYHGIQR